MEAPKCLRCGGEMRQGFVKDSDAAGMFPHGYLPQWLDGAPSASWLGGVKAKGNRSPLPVGGYRCEKCGWLDFYAGTRFEAR